MFFSFDFLSLVVFKLFGFLLIYRYVKSYLPANSQCAFETIARTNPRCYAERMGYSMVVHQVTTKDGYILDLINLKQKNRIRNSNATAILFMHSPIGAADAFLDRKVLDYLDTGYDIWIGNHRGDRYANCHVTVQNGHSIFGQVVNVFGNKQNYWDFSFHEMGIFDLPALIEKIQFEKDNRNKIFYVGHSLAATAYLVFASVNSSFAAQRIERAVLIAPISVIDHDLIGVQGFEAITTLYRFKWTFGSISYGLYGVKKICDVFRRLGLTNLFSFLPMNVCSLADVTYMIRNYDFMTSTKTLKHFLQQSPDSFNYYDSCRGYPLENIRTKLSLIACSTDIVFDEKSLTALEIKLTANNVDYDKYVERNDCSTLSMVMADRMTRIQKFIRHEIQYRNKREY